MESERHHVAITLRSLEWIHHVEQSAICFARHLNTFEQRLKTYRYLYGHHHGRDTTRRRCGVSMILLPSTDVIILTYLLRSAFLCVFAYFILRKICSSYHYVAR